ncbi:hypothetical protein Tco_1123136 [Tanacetum coccineum]|uniref:Uncharacterized protein n=1 Tax=Tanacetum coccineum TaxID=301880 RepID=A0ABQ5J325_9ASTR
MDKMTIEGYIEASHNHRLGKRVVQSDLTKKKLAKVEKVLDMDVLEDANETLNQSNVFENPKDHTIGSLTRTKDKSELQQNISNRSDLILSKLREKRQKTPMSNNQSLQKSMVVQWLCFTPSQTSKFTAPSTYTAVEAPKGEFGVFLGGQITVLQQQ